MRKGPKLSVLITLFSILNIHAQVSVSNDETGENIFPLVANSNAVFFSDQEANTTVKKMADLFLKDVQRVTGKEIQHRTSTPREQENIIIYGTVGNSSLIDKLVSEGKIDVSEIQGGWEQYLISLIDNPFAGRGKALVVVGSDRRGAAYGLLSISEAIGVSPWYWWADIPIEKRRTIHLKVENMTSEVPSVKYRGIFINDEDWGLKPWASKTFEPEVNDIGPKTYSKICELLIRLKANYLSPAMHEVTAAFNSFPENKFVADSFGIVMGSIHAEPLLFNNATEWDRETMGVWDYTKNKEGINKVLTQRVTENKDFENVYTLALRGIHDAVMAGNLPMEERVNVLENALNDQRKILDKILEEPLSEIPQVFYPYKEVLDIYDNGLEVPEDVTIVWPDDAYGYMRRLSNSEEQKRLGRAGVYYHVSYWGPPNYNLWTCTTPPVLMYEELDKAYRTTADRLWLVNVGDIKPAEYQITLFMDMAYDIDKFDYDYAFTHNVNFLTEIFGEEYYSDFTDILSSYYHLTFVRKPEYMERRTDTEFSIMNYKEVDTRLEEYDRIAKKAGNIMHSLDEEYVPAFFQLVYYPIKGAALVDKMTLEAQRNRLYSSQGRASANVLQKEVLGYIDSLQALTKNYNSLLDGKWKYMMAIRTGGGRLDEVPRLDSVEIAEEPVLGIAVEGEETWKGVRSYKALPAFNKLTRKKYFIDVFNKGVGQVNWRAESSDPWILLDKNSGETALDERIWVSIDWDKVDREGEILGHITISTDRETEKKVLVSIFNPKDITRKELSGIYVEDNGYVSIDPAGFHRKVETEDIKFKVIENLGYENEVLQLGDPLAQADYYDRLVLTSNYVAPARRKYPVVEYDFYSFNSGPITVYTYMVPTAPLNTDRGSRYGVMVDKSPVFLPSVGAPEYSLPWIQSALKNNRINKTVHILSEPGMHTLKIFAADPGMLLQKIVVDFGGLKKSYQGPRPTKVDLHADFDKLK